MDIRTYLAKRLASVGSKLGLLVVASVVMIGTAQAQNAATTSNHASVSGIQSVITQTRELGAAPNAGRPAAVAASAARCDESERP